MAAPGWCGGMLDPNVVDDQKEAAFSVADKVAAAKGGNAEAAYVDQQNRSVSVASGRTLI